MSHFTINDVDQEILRTVDGLQGGTHMSIAAHQITRRVSEKLGVTQFSVNLALNHLQKRRVLRRARHGFYSLTNEGQDILASI